MCWIFLERPITGGPGSDGGEGRSLRRAGAGWHGSRCDNRRGARQRRRLGRIHSRTPGRIGRQAVGVGPRRAGGCPFPAMGRDNGRGLRQARLCLRIGKTGIDPGRCRVAQRRPGIGIESQWRRRRRSEGGTKQKGKKDQQNAATALKGRATQCHANPPDHPSSAPGDAIGAAGHEAMCRELCVIRAGTPVKMGGIRKRRCSRIPSVSNAPVEGALGRPRSLRPGGRKPCAGVRDGRDAAWRSRARQKRPPPR